MEDPVLNRKLEECKELHQRWQQFHDFFGMATKGERVTPQAEMKFLELKTRIAMLHDAFMNALAHDHKTGQNVLSILASCIMLRRIPLLSNAEIQKIEFDWNEVYLLMTETIGTLEEEQEQLLGINATSYKLGRVKQRFFASIHNFIVSPMVRLVTILGVLFLIVWLPTQLTDFSYRNLPSMKGMAWTGSIVFWMEGRVRSAMKEYPYRVFSEHSWPEDTGALGTNYRTDRDKAQGLTIQNFKTQLVQMGYGVGAVDRINEIIDRRLAFESESIALTNQGRGSQVDDLEVFQFLFLDSQDAQDFVRLRREALDGNPTLRDALDIRYNFSRARNLVVVFNSEEGRLRLDYPKDKYGFEDSQMNN